MKSLEASLHYKGGATRPDKVDVYCSIDSGCYKDVDPELLKQMLVVGGQHIRCPGEERCLLIPFDGDNSLNMDRDPEFSLVKRRKYIRKLPSSV